MRFLKRQTLNRRIPADTTLYSDATNSNVYIQPYGLGTTTTGQGSVVIPNGTTLQRPSAPQSGMLRYNTTLNEVEVYQGSTWRSLRYKESTGITQQNLGAGDGTTVYFGPLNPAPPTVVQTGSGGTNVAWGGQNILVIVENVIQVSGINYTVSTLNPTIGAETYVPTVSQQAAIGATTIYFNSSLNITGASGNGTTVTLTFATQPATPFAIGSSIIVTGITPLAYNGTYTVTATPSNGSVQFASSTTTTYQNGGNITASTAIFPAVNLVGAIVTGSAALQASTAITAFTTDPVTDALTSITINKPTVTSVITVNTAITITEASQTGTGYYLQFTSPVPYGKVVIALIGFDQ